MQHPLLKKEFQPSEAAITTLKNDEMLIIVRRKRGLNSVIGYAKPPYKNWDFRELPIAIEGQALLNIKDKIILAGRDFRNKKRYMTVMSLDNTKSLIQSQIHIRPAHGDFAYPGLEVFNQQLCMTYYKNGKIYFIALKEY